MPARIASIHDAVQRHFGIDDLASIHLVEVLAREFSATATDNSRMGTTATRPLEEPSMEDEMEIDNREDFALWAIESAKQIVGEQGYELARASRDGTDDDVRQAGNDLGQAITDAL